MSDAISVTSSLFTEIPTNILVPGNYGQVSPIYDNGGLLPYPAHILIIAQMSAAGKAVPLKIYPLLNPAQATNLCGAGSIGEAQAISVLATNPTVPVDIMCVADANTSAKATGSFIINGAWSTNGTVPLSIAGVTINTGTLATDTPVILAPEIAANINAQINPDLPVTATVIVGAGGLMNKILLTANNAGTESNNIDLFVAPGPNDVLPVGMAITMTPMTGGTLNPSISAAIAAIANIWYSDIHMPWSDTANQTAFNVELAARYTALSHLDAQGYCGFVGTYAQIASAKASLNSQFACFIAGTNLPTPHWQYSATLCGVTAQSRFDSPQRQIKGRVLPGIVGPRPADRIGWQEQQLLLGIGVTTFDVLKDGTVVTQRVVTENLSDNNGTLTAAWRDVTVPSVASRIRYDWRSYISVTYPSNTLAEDGSLAAENDKTVATPNRLKGSWAARCNLYGKLGWIEDVQNQVRNAIFAIDQNDPNRVNATQPYKQVGNLIVLASAIQFQS